MIRERIISEKPKALRQDRFQALFDKKILNNIKQFSFSFINFVFIILSCKANPVNLKTL